MAVLFASSYIVFSKNLVLGFDFMSRLQQLKSGSASWRRSGHWPLLGPDVVVIWPHPVAGDLVSGDRWSSIRRSLRSLFSGHCSAFQLLHLWRWALPFCRADSQAPWFSSLGCVLTALTSRGSLLSGISPVFLFVQDDPADGLYSNPAF